MNHHKSNRKFGRVRNQRNALLKTLAVSLILKEKIKTTGAKAKEIRPFVEKLITQSKTDTLASKRLIISRIGENKASKKLFETVGPKFKDRNGGYLRIIKLQRRLSDGSEMAQIEFV